jgi:CSLREA domain-containing protein
MNPLIRRCIISAIAFLAAAAVWAAPARADAVRLLVNTADDHDDGVCDDVDCTLREAIRTANDDGMDDQIAFDLPAPHLITISSLLPVLTEDGTVIDGTTDPDYRTEPVVVLAGDPVKPVPVGLEIRAARCAVRGLSLIQFEEDADGNAGAIYISGGEGNLVELNHIGIAPVAVSARNSIGVRLAADGQTIRDNVISGNEYGIRVDEGFGRETIQGNRIGTDPSGLKAMPNRNGIWLMKDSFEVVIGGPGRGNLISGNDNTGIIAQGYRHILQSNWIGTDVTGGISLRNIEGVVIDGPADGIRIGGSGADEGNVVSGNWDAGILIGDGAHTIQGNKIGTDSTGTRALSNTDGVVLTDFYSAADGKSYASHDVTVGGVMGSGAENVISGNSFQGISILTGHHIIQGNFIGTDISGTAAIPNDVGIHFSLHAVENLIGGTEPGLGNVISGNAKGMTILTDNNTVVGNKIGTDRGGSSAVRNMIGVLIFGNDNLIGTGAPGASNVISGNRTGISIEGGSGNRVLGNRIGTNADGSIAVPNSIGIALGLDYDLDPSGTVIGAPGAGNWIEHNSSCGVWVMNGVHGAQIVENTIAHNGSPASGWCTGQGIALVEEGLAVAQITVSRNSIFQNAGKGIEFFGSDVNGSIEAPVLTRGSLSSVEGTACPGCKVEIFLADVDPTGFGEGKTYLTETTAGADGSFSAALTGVHMCDVLTATATDAAGNTSEFSRNYDGVACLRLPPVSVLLGIPGLIAIFGFGTLFLMRRRRRARIPAAVAGGLIGGGLGVLVLVMPFVRVNPPQYPAGPGESRPPIPACSQFLDVSRAAPADGSIFETGTDVRIEVYPLPVEPDVQTRWRLEVTGPAGTSAAKEFSGEISIPLSELGLDPSTPGAYAWYVSGEWQDPNTQQWTPLCQDRMGRAFLLSPDQTEGNEAQIPNGQTESSTGTTPVPDSSAPVATLRNDANCRKGPGTDYSAVTTLPRGGTYPIDGRNAEGDWWWVRLPGQLGHCWVAGRNVDAGGNTPGLPVVESPPLGCWIKPNPQALLEECVVPCPQGADSSRTCEP